MFINTNQPFIKSFYTKKVPIFRRISDKSALIRNIRRNERVRGKPIGRLRVNLTVSLLRSEKKIFAVFEPNSFARSRDKKIRPAV